MASRVVYKHPFATDPVQAVLRVDVPEDSEPVHFDFQGGVPTLWIEHRLDRKDREQLTFVLFGTGHELPDDKKLVHVGSAVGYNGGLVLHCYEDIGE